VTAGVALDWKTLSYRDTNVVAGVAVWYRVTSVLSGGSESTSATSVVFMMPGTALSSIEVDADNLLVELTWRKPSEGAVGFEVSRRAGDSAAEVIFTTDDLSVRSFTDTDISGGLVYEYELTTLLGDQSRVRSETLEAPIFRLLKSGSFSNQGVDDTFRLVRDNPQVFSLRGFGGVVARGQSLRYTAMDVNGSGVFYLTPITADEIPHSDLSPTSFSLERPSVDRRQSGSAVYLYMGALVPSGAESFVEVATSAETGTVLTKYRWPASNATRTGLVVFGGKVLFFAGSDLRLLDESTFEVLEETTISEGEPIDVEYVDGSIWLVYPDHLLKGDATQSLPNIVWDTLMMPDDVTVTRTTNFRDKLLVLDGVNAKLHLFDSTGQLRISWDAHGADVIRGDIAVPIDKSAILQSDGKGDVFLFDPDGRYSNFGARTN